MADIPDCNHQSPKVLRTASLFSGSGMLDRGVADALSPNYSVTTALYCERDPYAQQVLRARMADGSIHKAPLHPDITTLHLAPNDRIDAIIAGFPCQPFSLAGNRAGVEDERYLFGDIIRLANEGRVPLLFLENVAALLSANKESVSPFGDVLRLLAESGFDAVWHCVRAEDAGAPHRRERFFCIAWRKELADAHEA